MNEKIRLAIIQKICPAYRVSVFMDLAQRFDQIVFYGRGETTGVHQNAKDLNGLKSRRLFTLSHSIVSSTREFYLSWFPSLMWHLIRYRPQVVLTEGTTNMPNNVFIFLYAKLFRVPVIWWDAGRDMRKKPGRWRRWTGGIVELFIRWSDVCLGYGEMAREYFLSLGKTSDRIFVARNTVNVQQIQADLQKVSNEDLQQLRDRLDLNDKDVLIYVGGIEERKRIDLLIDALAAIQKQRPHTALLVIGDGRKTESLQQYVDKLGVPNVHFLGRITSGLAEYWRVSDVLVLPGQATLAINQAMAAGVPVVSVNTGGPEYENIIPEQTGYLVPPNSLQKLTASVLKILNDTRLKQQMSKNAREAMTDRLNMQSMVGDIAQTVVRTYEMRQHG